MDIGKAFGFVFDDENWVRKVLIGGLLNIIPLLGQLFTCGYLVETARLSMEDPSTKMPEWDDWGGKLVKGLIYFVISLVYSLPLIIVALCFGGLMAIVGASARSEDVVTAFGTVGGICVGLLGLVYALLMALVLPAAVARYAYYDDISAAFHFGEVFRMVKDNIGTYVIVLLLSLLLGVIIAPLGGIVCGLGALWTMFYATTVMGHLYGQAYRVARPPASEMPL